MHSLLLPIDITFKDWASQLRIDLPSVTIPTPPDVSNWKNWASQVIQSNSLQNVPLPTEIAYPLVEDWRKWAVYFINSIN